MAQQQPDGVWRFEDDPPVLTRVDEATRAKMIASLVEYAENLAPEYRFMLRRYAVADVAHRVVGVGSVGNRAYLVLLFGNGDTDPLFLQIKEAVVPAHARYLPPFPLRVDHEGCRVVVGQRMLQALGDPLLGWTTIDGRPYYVRQMKNMKASMPVAFLTGEPFDFWSFACRGVLARAHARAGDAARISGYCGRATASPGPSRSLLRTTATRRSATTTSSSAPSRPAGWRRSRRCDRRGAFLWCEADQSRLTARGSRRRPPHPCAR